MGNCGSGGSEEAKVSRQIDSTLKKDMSRLKQEIKLLLLGAGESGKSTIAKQMKIIHMEGFTEEERITFRAAIHSNIMVSMRNLVLACDDLGIEIEEQNASIAEQFKPITFLSKQMVLTQELANKVKRLWGDSGIKAAFERSSEFQLNDSAAYFFDAIDRLVDAFQVEDQDILRARVMTTGVSEIEFAIENCSFRMVDVGGQRSERKKWIHCFQDITAIIFCAAISEYDLYLAEDSTVNRMWESLKIFDEIANITWFNKTAIILFLNKKDIFEEKIKKGISLQKCFPEYSGSTVEDAQNFLRDKFVSKSRSGKDIFTHITIATNTENIRVVFNSVKNVLLAHTIEDAGF